MPNKKQIYNSFRWLVPLLFAALCHALSAQEAAPENSMNEASTRVTPSPTNDTNSDQSTPEPPIENAATAQPSLKYEPSERISEDSSVSFPVDI